MSCAVAPSRLYAIVDARSAAAAGWSVPALARAVLAGGARWLQVRAPGTPSGQLLDWCDEVVVLASAAGAHVVVNDRPDIAVMASAHGVHLGQDDLDVDAARAIMPSAALVGRSTHSVAQVTAALAQGADYVAVGPVFPTTTKVTGYAAVGAALVQAAVARASGAPVVAIGGITLATAPRVLDAGAAAVAVISDLLTGGEPERRVAQYVAALR